MTAQHALFFEDKQNMAFDGPPPLNPEQLTAMFAEFYQSFELKKLRSLELYGERDANIKVLGFTDYNEYLQSRRYWRGLNGIRQRVLRRDKSACAGCGARTRIVHHRRYTMEALTGHDLAALITICEECHHTIEFDSTGGRRSRGDQESVLRIMREEMGFQ